MSLFVSSKMETSLLIFKFRGSVSGDAQRTGTGSPSLSGCWHRTTQGRMALTILNRIQQGYKGCRRKVSQHDCLPRKAWPRRHPQKVRFVQKLVPAHSSHKVHMSDRFDMFKTGMKMGYLSPVYPAMSSTTLTTFSPFDYAGLDPEGSDTSISSSLLASMPAAL